MNNEIVNKTTILFAQGEKEFLNAKKNINNFYDGKIRTIARRAAGFYLEGYLNFTNRLNYGKSFINHLKAIEKDEAIPLIIREAANNLIAKVGKNELSGIESLQFSEKIINYCISEFNKFKKENE
jgi:hypothetical protein